MKTNCNLKRVYIAGALLMCVGYLVRGGLGQGTTGAGIDPITGLPLGPVGAPPAKFGNIVLESRGKDWRLSDLYKTAADWISKNEHAPLEVTTNVGVRIYLQSTNALCQFTFAYPRAFGKNMWMITMGTDGSIAGCFKAKVGEGMPPGMTMPPPPPDKFSEPPPK